MITWESDTCYCKIKSKSPAIQGEYLERCRIHQNSRDTRDCYLYNIAHQERADPDEDSREQKKRVTRDLTRP